MSDEEAIGRRYRMHADELRAIAESDRNAFTHDTLLRIAADYDNMADTMDQLHTMNDGFRKRYSPA